MDERLLDVDIVPSGVAEMMVSSFADFAGAAWEPYQRELAFTLREAPLSPVYAKVRDGAGNESRVATLLLELMAGWPDEAVVAHNSVWLRQGSFTSGGVAVIDASSGPVLAEGAEAVLEHDARLEGRLVADSIVVKTSATVAGSAYFNELGGSGSVEGTLSSPLALPLALRTPRVPELSPGDEAITLSPKQDRVLPAGSYGAVTLRAGTHADPTVLTLEGGTYDLRSLDLGPRSRLECASPCAVRIAGRLTSGPNATVGPAAGSGLSAADVELTVAGLDGDSGQLGTAPRAATLGHAATVVARIHVPHGTLLVHQGGAARGTFVARDVEIGAGVVLTKE